MPSVDLTTGPLLYNKLRTHTNPNSSSNALKSAVHVASSSTARATGQPSAIASLPASMPPGTDLELPPSTVAARVLMVAAPSLRLLFGGSSSVALTLPATGLSRKKASKSAKLPRLPGDVSNPASSATGTSASRLLQGTWNTCTFLFGVPPSLPLPRSLHGEPPLTFCGDGAVGAQAPLSPTAPFLAQAANSGLLHSGTVAHLLSAFAARRWSTRNGEITRLSVREGSG